MRLVFNGWKRDCGSVTLASARIEITPAPERLSLEEAKAHEWELAPGVFGIRLVMGAPEVRLNGDYLVTLQLADHELADLFMAACSNRPAGDVIALLSMAAAKIGAKPELGRPS